MTSIASTSSFRDWLGDDPDGFKAVYALRGTESTNVCGCDTLLCTVFPHSHCPFLGHPGIVPTLLVSKSPTSPVFLHPIMVFKNGRGVSVAIVFGNNNKGGAYVTKLAAQAGITDVYSVIDPPMARRRTFEGVPTSCTCITAVKLPSWNLDVLDAQSMSCCSYHKAIRSLLRIAKGITSISVRARIAQALSRIDVVLPHGDLSKLDRRLLDMLLPLPARALLSAVEYTKDTMRFSELAQYMSSLPYSVLCSYLDTHTEHVGRAFDAAFDAAKHMPQEDFYAFTRELSSAFKTVLAAVPENINIQVFERLAMCMMEGLPLAHIIESAGASNRVHWNVAMDPYVQHAKTLMLSRDCMFAFPLVVEYIGTNANMAYAQLKIMNCLFEIKFQDVSCRIHMYPLIDVLETLAERNLYTAAVSDPIQFCRPYISEDIMFWVRAFNVGADILHDFSVNSWLWISRRYVGYMYEMLKRIWNQSRTRQVCADLHTDLEFLYAHPESNPAARHLMRLLTSSKPLREYNLNESWNRYLEVLESAFGKVHDIPDDIA